MTIPEKIKTAAGLLGLVFLTQCAKADDPDEIKPNNQNISYELVVEGLRIPWGMVFLPEGGMLISEKKGELWLVKNGELADAPVEGTPEVYERGQGGLMDLELHPNYVDNGWIYLSYSSQKGTGKGGNTHIARARLDGNRLVDLQTLYQGSPNTTRPNHFGSRIEFDRDGYLFFSIGDRFDRDKNPQNIHLDGGKIYRIMDDGTIPEDNPFFGRSGAKKAIWSYGHRNPQGLALNPVSGEIWSHEHGPQGGDEVNLIHRGKNYGWPVISYGINYDGSTFAVATSKPGMEQPVIYWVPSIAPCGMTFITGDKYPGWEGDLVVGSLKFNYLVRCTLEGDKIINQEKIAEGIGRVRNVRLGPDGYLYVAVEGKGIYRLIYK